VTHTIINRVAELAGIFLLAAAALFAWCRGG
jgi:hypothetical protein